MSLSHGSNIVKDGLDIALDTANIKSYPGIGSVWYNLKDRSVTESTNNTWGNGFSSFSIMCFIEILGSDLGYAYHPINKWNSGTGDASFVLYNFQGMNGATPNRFGWYANAGGAWKGISSITPQVSTGVHFVGIQYNSTSGGQMWLDGATYGGRTGNGVVGSGSGNITIQGGPDPTSLFHTKCVFFYNKELTNAEMKQNFEALRGRYGI